MKKVTRRSKIKRAAVRAMGMIEFEMAQNHLNDLRTQLVESLNDPTHDPLSIPPIPGE